MKAKLSYKSKRNLIISLIIVALIAVIAVSTYFFTKGNEDKSQAFSQGGAQADQADDISKNDNTDQMQDTKAENAITPNIENTNSTTKNTENNLSNNNGVSNTDNRTNTTTSGSNNTGTTTETTNNNVPNQEYVSERVEHIENVLVGEDYTVAWNTVSLSASTSLANKKIVRDVSKYTVNYIEEGTNNNISDSKSVDDIEAGNIINSKDEIIDIDGYVFSRAEKDSIIIRTDESQNVINLYYTKRADLKYTVNYLEKDTNNVLQPAKTVENVTFKTEVKAIDEKVEIDGYVYDSANPDSITVGTDASQNVINLYYTKRADLKYTVNYLEKDTNNVLQPAKTVENVTFKTEVKAIDEKVDIDGYVYDSANPDSITEGTDASKNVINLYYTKRADLKYTVNYLEKDTNNVLKDAKTVENVTFKTEVTAESEKVEIDGYVYDSANPDSITVGTDASQNVINLYYTKRADLKYTVNYLELDTNKVLQTRKTAEATFADVITAMEEKIEIPGYTYKLANPDRIVIATDESKNVLNLYYTKRTDLKYTVNYLEKDTDQVLRSAKTDQATFEEVINAKDEIVNIEGYKYIYSNPESITISADETENIINIYYEKIPEVNYKVEYYFNGVHDTKIKADTTGTVLLGKEIPFEKPDEIGEYQYLGYYEFNDKKNAMPVEAINGENLIKVYYGKSEVEINKTATSQVRAGEVIDYTITVTNKGYVSSTVTVTDELKETTYVENSANIKPDITTDANNIQTLKWNIELEAASNNNKVVTKTITFKARTAEDYIGKTVKNKAVLTEGNKTKTSDANTEVKEITVKYNEFKEGRKGTDLNIIFVVDNSSSMNGPTAGKTYANKDSYCPVAPSDRNKTKLYDAKEAIKKFIAKQNGKNTDMRVITFNTPSNQNKVTLKVLKDKVDKNQVYNGWAKVNGNWVEVVKASDNNYYTFEEKAIDTGAISVGTNSTSNANLITAVDNITISDDQGGLGTNIVPAYDLIINNKEKYLSNTKKNIVIVLADGGFNDAYNGKKYNTLEGMVDDIYSIGFGNGYNASSLKKIATDGKCHDAKDADGLLKAFDEIAAEATGTEKTTISEEGVVTLDEASDAIKITSECPIKATYIVNENGKNVEKILFECTDKNKLSDYGLTISNNKQIIWDANEYVKNHGALPSDVIKIIYYIPRS